VTSPPAEFIATSEECGLIAEIGAWVAEAACREAMNWPDDIKVAVNLSPTQFDGGALTGHSEARARAWGTRSAWSSLETQGQFDMLCAQGCDQAQGCFCDWPMAASEIPLRLSGAEKVGVKWGFHVAKAVSG
jgi:EAL domain-containing protein (putative c-di-GMP-specific phosphodiesterase class I)